MGWEKACGDETCCECGETLEDGEDMYVATGAHGEVYCEGCHEDMCDDECYDDRDYGDDDYPIDGVGFQDPGGRSSLRAETEDNPRNLPCGGCGTENALTPLDKRAGYVCNGCADRAEGRGGYGDY
jgi:hypothetical protein